MTTRPSVYMADDAARKLGRAFRYALIALLLILRHLECCGSNLPQRGATNGSCLFPEAYRSHV